MSNLERLFYWQGIADEYQNFRGELVRIPIQNRMNILATMGVDVTSDESIEAKAYELDVAPWKELAPPLQICPSTSGLGFYLNLTPNELADPIQWEIMLDKKLVQQGNVVPGQLREVGDYRYGGVRFSRRFQDIVALSPGYYSLRIKSLSRSAETVLAILPENAYENPQLLAGEKIWGVITQLYTLRSEQNWGVGDFRDLKQLISQLAGCGADVIGLNPLHALLPDIETHCSPYSPSDRLFLNPIYIDVEGVAGFDAALVSSEAVQELNLPSINDLRNCVEVDYRSVKKLKYFILAQLFIDFCQRDIAQNSQEAFRFLEFVVNKGESLSRFASYESSHNVEVVFIGRGDTVHVTCDNDEFNDVVANEVRAIDFKFSEHLTQKIQCSDSSHAALDTGLHMESYSFKEDVLFHMYLQWIAHSQLESCQDLTETLGMKVGLVRDLAVGADAGGAEVNNNPELFCRDSAVGAPPDPMAMQGQNWGIPPIIPFSLRESGFAHFIELLRDNMAHCGALRIDHAMSLMRLWWCPPGETADHGAYVNYPFEEMMGLLTLESHLNKCVIIGEDLGIVPSNFRERLAKEKIYSNKVFYFEKHHDFEFKWGGEYDFHALAMLNNHDVATLTSWWNKADIKLRDELNILGEGVSFEDACHYRENEKINLRHKMRERGFWPDTWADAELEKEADKSLVYAIVRYASAVNSQIYVLQIEDVLGMESPVNVPGTYKEYPNWKRKLSSDIEKIFSDKDTVTLLNDLSAIRRS